ncbi:hypothetical protein CROQUDRAFT_476266 [Cronartium quercuum f. sp. fusiforme G11]|uniref:TLC domain-containing protein n=1 Tax=Cronartium quercuum f. sp. fusiforme G11 TaxID=708437 RepID=A0A9P6NJW5_9BASI|nr:hypothetical protein CROQUDRAFT_476266 [Cronartium quercuum f. sp. fusiforme G11]
MSDRIIRYTSKSRRGGIVQVCAEWHLTTALSIITLIVALNFSFPEFSDPTIQSLSTYQTRLPTIQYKNPIPKFIYLSYFNPNTGEYLKGNDDIYFVGFWILIWLSLRELSIRFIWKPFGSLCGLKNKNKLQRFAEQGWNLAYYSVFWCIGVKILSNFPNPILSLNIRQYWHLYPHDSLPALTKFYYLAQTAFWFQQLIVINLEKPRKDHYQMFAHHVVTIILVSASYAINFTGIGTAIHVTMDVADIFLFIAKMLNYAGGGILCDSVFAIFVLAWIYTRHYIFSKIIYSIYADLPIDISFDRDPLNGRLACFQLWIIFLSLLVLLQLLLLFWLALILRIFWKVLIGDGANDERDSDEEVEGSNRLNKDLLGPVEKGGLSSINEKSSNSVANVEEYEDLLQHHHQQQQGGGGEENGNGSLTSNYMCHRK